MAVQFGYENVKQLQPVFKTLKISSYFYSTSLLSHTFTYRLYQTQTLPFSCSSSPLIFRSQRLCFSAIPKPYSLFNSDFTLAINFCLKYSASHILFLPIFIHALLKLLSCRCSAFKQKQELIKVSLQQYQSLVTQSTQSTDVQPFGLPMLH